MKVLLALWIVLATWLVPARGLARDAGPFGREIRTAEGRSGSAATAPQRLETQLRPPAAPGGGASSAPQAPPASRVEWPRASVLRDACGATLRATTAHRPRPRRLCFAYEATAPPARLS